MFLNVVVAPGQMCGDALLHPALAHQVVLHSVVHHSLTHVHNAVPATEIKGRVETPIYLTVLKGPGNEKSFNWFYFLKLAFFWPVTHNESFYLFRIHGTL